MTEPTEAEDETVILREATPAERREEMISLWVGGVYSFIFTAALLYAAWHVGVRALGPA